MKYPWARVVVIAMALIVAAPFAGAQTPDVEPEDDYSAVLVRFAEIIGEVYISSQSESAERAPAAKVRIQVRDVETDELLSETYTDDRGVYMLPRFDVGPYFLHVGALRLNMRVIPDVQTGEELPKIIVVLIPEEMAWIARNR